MKLGCLVVASILLSACGYENPTEPTTPVNQPTAGVPARIELGAVPGVGQQGGTGTISARVFDAFTAALPNQTVAFSASGGELGEPSAVTDDKGVARTTITGPAGAAITITAAVGTLEQKAQIAMQAKPDAPPPLVPPVFPPPTPPQPPAPPQPPPAPSYTVTLTALPPSIVVNGTSTLTAAVVANNGATAPTGYAWDCNADGTFDAPIADNFKVCTYTVAGTIKSAVRVTSTTASGSASVDVTVAAAAPLLVAVTASPNTVLATGAPVTYTATLSSTGGASAVPTTGVDWEWDTDGDGTYDSASTLHANTDLITVTYSAPKEFTVKVRATDTATGRTAIGTRAVKVQ